MSIQTARDFTPGQRVAIARQAQTWFKGSEGVVADIDTDRNSVEVRVTVNGETRVTGYWPGYLTAL
jgi:transcription antitermination factor NusG